MPDPTIDPAAASWTEYKALVIYRLDALLEDNKAFRARADVTEKEFRDRLTAIENKLTAVETRSAMIGGVVATIMTAILSMVLDALKRH